jgi:hypothetical protein
MIPVDMLGKWSASLTLIMFHSRDNGFELSRPARFSDSFPRFFIKSHRLQIALPAGSAAANGYAPNTLSRIT